ncbi:MAG TPA: hypothetical protein VJT83_00210 [Chitinophagaceae bacterium]|nr:hypothetical protein [Chitinophagaceae bacterium]
MKNFGFLLIVLFPLFTNAQQESFAIRAGGGYAHDFPGLNGYGGFAEVSKPLSEKLQGAIGVKINNLSGFPRTEEVNEFTKSTSLDFSLYFLPFSNEINQVRLGAGYSFSFYKIRRSYPIITQENGAAKTTWPVKESKGRVSGLTLVAEYEYFVPETNFSLGLRGSLFKAYDHVLFAGGFVGFRF